MASAWLAAIAAHDSAGTLFINTIGVKMDPSSGDGLSSSDLAAECWTWFGTEWRAATPTRLTLDSITVRKMPEPTTDEGVHAIGVAGQETEDANIAKEICVTLSWKTDHPGRSGRGHIAFPVAGHGGLFLSGGNSFDLTQHQFATSIPALLAKLDAGHDWGPAGADGHLSHVVWSRKNAAYYDVKARLIRSAPRWLERRQTAP